MGLVARPGMHHPVAEHQEEGQRMWVHFSLVSLLEPCAGCSQGPVRRGGGIKRQGLRFGFERKRVTELSDSRQDPGKSGRSAREDTQTLERTMVIHAIFLGVYTWI